MKFVIKRDGRKESFKFSKIVMAILGANSSVPEESQLSQNDLKEIFKTVEKICDSYETGQNIEVIQNIVEEQLMFAGAFDVARNFIKYRYKHEMVRNVNNGVKNTMIDYKTIIDNYLQINDWRVKENSTVTYSVGGLILSNSGAITANYWLSEVYDDEIGNAHRNADLHIHDLSMLTGYCAGWSLKQLIQEGLGNVPGKITSSPAAHLSTLCNQMVNFLGIMQNEWAGAQAFSSFDTYLAPFVKIDNLSYKEVKQCIQSFIYGVNTPSRWGTQSPFTNITLDWTVPADLAELNCIVGGKEVDFKYKDCKKEMDMINKAFIEVMLEGDANGRGFQYPIPTYSITRDFDWSETENNKLLFEMTSKYGTPYFSNYINSDMEPSDVRSMCPLTGDTEVVVRSSHGISKQTIYQLYHNQSQRSTKYEVWTPEGWCEIKFNRQPMTKVYEITLSNGAKVKMGENHLQPTKTGTRSAKYLEVGDWLPFNKAVIETNNIGTYNLGIAVGAYAGDGSCDKKAIVYSLDAGEKDDETQQLLVDFWNSVGFETKVTYGRGNVRFVRVNGNPYDIIETYVEGKDALTKSLTSKVYNASVDFKRGFICGYRLTDGSRDKKRLYTSSKQMKNDICELLSSIGNKYMANYVDERAERFGKNPNYRVDYPQRENYGNYYKTDGDFNYYSIVEINEITEQGEYLYCGEVANEEHLFMLANGLITHNCRLRLDLRELRKKSGGYFGSGESTGSIGVVTINMPRIGYLAENKEDFYNRLDKLMDIAARSLKIKRTVITKLLENDLYPYTKRYLKTFGNHFSTIGLVGMNEACFNAKWLNKDLTNKEAQDFTEEVLNHMRERLSDYQEQYGDLYNLEATPAESTSYRLAKHDKDQWPDILTANENGTPYYTNSSHLPVGYTEDIFSALDIQDKLQTLYTSGTVFHAFLGEKLPSWKSAATLVKKIAENYQLPYYTLSPTYSVCKNHGYIAGEVYTCPTCGEKTEVYSRITGYYRPIQNWNDGKTQEFKDRKVYNLKRSRPMQEHCATCGVNFEENELPEIPQEDKIYLFATPTCPNCKIACALLDKAGVAYEKIYATEQPDMAKNYGIKQAPTLVLIKNGNINKYANVSEIKKFLGV